MCLLLVITQISVNNPFVIIMKWVVVYVHWANQFIIVIHMECYSVKFHDESSIMYFHVFSCTSLITRFYPFVIGCCFSYIKTSGKHTFSQNVCIYYSWHVWRQESRPTETASWKQVRCCHSLISHCVLCALTGVHLMQGTTSLHIKCVSVKWNTTSLTPWNLALLSIQCSSCGHFNMKCNVYRNTHLFSTNVGTMHPGSILGWVTQRLWKSCFQ